MKKPFSTSILVLPAILFLIPISAFASGPFSLSNATFSTVVCYLVGLVELIIPILFLLAFVLFFWGLSKFVINSSGNQKELEVGKNYMLWGILALFVLVTFQTIVGIVTNEFGFGNGQASGYPFLPGSGVVCGANPPPSPTFQVDSNINYGGEAPSQTN